MKLLLKSWRAFGSRGVWDTPENGVEKKIKKKNKENHTRDGVEKKRRRPDGLG